jgi:hypothetical protein
MAKQAAKANTLNAEATAVALDRSHPVTLRAKMFRLELLRVGAVRQVK